MRLGALPMALCALGCGTSHPEQPADAAPDAALPDAIIDAPSDFPVDAFTPAMHFDRSSYDFGVVPAPDTVSPRLVSVVNDSALPITITTGVTGAFSIIGSSCDAPIAPGGSCWLSVDVDVVLHGLGTASGTVTATAGTTSIQADLAADIRGYVTATMFGAGTGTISYSPFDPCDTGTCEPGGTPVTVTVVPAAGSFIVGWSEPSCGTSATCTVTASFAAHRLEVTVAADPTAFEMEFTGGGTGQVSVYQLYGGSAICYASCTVVVARGTDIQLGASTPVAFGGFGAPCPTGDTTCTVPGATGSVSVRFDPLAGEQELEVPGVVYSVDFSATGDLVLGTSAGVIALDTSLAIKWTAPPIGPARFDPAGDVFVVTTSEIVKLDPTGQVMWTRPGGLAIPYFDWWNHYAHHFATTPTNGVVVERNGLFEVWDANGTMTLSQATDPPRSFCTGVGPDGTIYVGVDSTFMPHIELRVQAFSPSGTRLLPDFAPGPDIDIDDESMCTLGIGTSRVVVSIKSEVSDFVGFLRFNPDRSGLSDTYHDYMNGSVPDPAKTAIAANAAGEVAFFYEPQESSHIPVQGMTLEKYSNAGVLLWRVSRPSTQKPVDGSYTGLDITDVAIASDGRVAAGGTFTGVGFSGIVEVFQ